MRSVSFDRQIVYASEAAGHQTIFTKFPVLVPIGPIPLAAVIVPLIGKPDCDPVLVKSLEFLY